METLEQIYNKHKKGDWPDKNSVHSYIPVYEELLRPYRSDARYIVEVGLMSGESLKMWDEYFEGNVCGIDCDVKPINGQADLTQAIKDGYNIVIGDASDPKLLELHFSKSTLNVVIEDANHDIRQQLDIYEAFQPYMSKGSIYIIEDVQDIDKTRLIFMNMGGEIIDLRHKKNRYDDVMIIFRN